MRPVGGGGKRRVRAGRVESARRERPTTRPEAPAPPQNPPAAERGQGQQQTVHSRLDQVCRRKHRGLAWEKVKKNRGSAGGDAVTLGQFEARKAYYWDLLHRQRRDGTYRPQPGKRVELPQSEGA